MSPSSTHDHTVSHIDGVRHRRDAAARSREVGPLWTREPLSHDRERRLTTQPSKKRRRPPPTKPALTFDPRCSHIPSGRQGPPPSPFSASVAQSPTSPEPVTPFADHEDHEQLYGYEHPHAISESSSIEPSTSSYPDTPNEGSFPLDNLYDSPASCTSSSSPSLSDQSPSSTDFPPEFVRPSVFLQDNQPYVQSYYPMDTYSSRAAQGYPTFYDPAYSRAAPHGIPVHPESNGYPYPPPHRF